VNVRLRTILAVALTAAVLLSGRSVATGQLPAGPPGGTPTGTGMIIGQVVDAIGNAPVGGAIVTLNGPGGTKSVLVESRGRFVFRDLPRGSFNLIATKPGWAEGAYGRRRPKGLTQRLDLAEGERVRAVSIPLWRHGTIAGVVRDEHGDPFVGLEVRALLKTYRTGDARWVAENVSVTDDRGAYRIAGLTPGEYTVVVPSTYFVGDTSQLPSNGMPLPTSSARGGAPMYRTTFYPNAVGSSEATSMPIRPGEERAGVDFELQPVPAFLVSGTIGGAVASGTRYSLEIMRAAETRPGRIAAVSDIRVGQTSSVDGQFRFLGVPSGQYLIRATSQGAAERALWAKEVVVVAGADMTDVVVTIRPGLTVSGRLEFEGASPPLSAERLGQIPILVETLDPRDAVSRVGRVTADRRFTVEGVPGGEFIIMVPGGSPAWHLKSVTTGGRDVTDRAIEISKDLSDVVLTFTDQATELRGRVTNSSGPDAGAAVLIYPGGGFPLTDLSWNNGSRRFQLIRTDKTGAYTSNRLPPGDYLVAAIPEEASANWINSEFLAQLSGIATAVHLENGEKRALDLSTRQVSR
jgi:hypothetical protein